MFNEIGNGFFLTEKLKRGFLGIIIPNAFSIPSYMIGKIMKSHSIIKKEKTLDKAVFRYNECLLYKRINDTGKCNKNNSGEGAESE